MDWNLIISAAPTYIMVVTMWYGIYYMNRGTEKRSEDSMRVHEEAMKKHEESMVALRALIERTRG